MHEQGNRESGRSRNIWGTCTLTFLGIFLQMRSGASQCLTIVVKAAELRTCTLTTPQLDLHLSTARSVDCS